MTVSIRLASVSDAADVVRLTAQLGYDVEPSEVSARLSRFLGLADHRFFIAEVEERPVGWLHASIWDYIETGAFVIIGGLVVDASHRRQGIGHALLSHAEGWARERGCSIVRVWSSTQRVQAHEFYARSGYEKVKTQHSFAKCVDPDRQSDVKRLVPRIKD